MSEVSGQQSTGQNTPTSGDAGSSTDVNNAPAGDESLLTGQGEAPEQPAEGDAPKPEGEKPKAEGEEPAAGELQFEVPEGFEVDETMAEAFKDTAKELGLDQDAVNKLTPLYEKAMRLQMDRHQEAVADWGEQVKTDKEIGGDKLQENLVVARKAIEQFGGDDLKEILNATGLGNHPAVVKFALRVGKAIDGDKFVAGSPNATGGDQSVAKRMFPGMN